jgi:transposase
MEENITGFVGLDAHAESTVIGLAEAGRAAPRYVGKASAKVPEIKRALSKLGEPASLLIVYEAGPCGYGLARELRAAGYRCEVIAPSKIPKKSGDRIKTDRRDALKLASLARAGELVAVLIPDERDEAIRDLSRARVDAVRARLKARQQLKALLLRHGRRYTGKSSWTAAHERYLAEITFKHPAQDIAYAEYRHAVGEGEARVQRLSQSLSQQVEGWRMQPVVRALMTLRGLDLIGATTVVAELGDLRRFAHPRHLMGYLGLVPSEHSSGSSHRQGAITKTRQQSRPPHPGRSGVELPLPGTHERAIADPARRPASRDPRDRLASTAAPVPSLSATERARTAVQHSLRCDRARAGRLYLGYRPARQPASLSSAHLNARRSAMS